MAATLNLSVVAKSLVALNLVGTDPITPSDSLVSAGDDASHQTFEKIARVLLMHCPPIWFGTAVNNLIVNREYIPAADLDALSWLGLSLDTILRDMYAFQKQDDPISKAIGDAAELIVIAALKRLGGSVIHVAKISDAFGYDIEYRHKNRIERIEVKGCSAQTADRFILTRNEFDKSRTFKSEWKLIQVIFKLGAVFGEIIGSEDVVALRELTPESIFSLCPPDRNEFRWRESAEFSPESSHWIQCQLELEPTFKAVLSGKRLSGQV